MTKYKVGIAGYGVVGKRRRQCIDAHPNMSVVAVCDKSFEGTGIFNDGVNFYKHYKELLKENLDILFVCLTNDIAAEVTIAGLENDLHVFCEKPPGRDLDDIARVIHTEKKYPHLKLKYGFNHRYHLSVQDAIEIVRSGRLGKVMNMKGVYGKSKIISFDSDWRTKRSVSGGGILLDQGIHMVDLMRLFAGEFSEIFSYISNDYWQHDVEDNAYALMKSESGVIAFLHSTATQWRHRFNLDITLEEGSVTLAGILSGSKSYGAETISIIEKSETDNGDPKETIVRYNEDPSWREEIEDFMDCIINQRTVSEGSSQDAWKTMELVYKIYCADKEWQRKYDLVSVSSLMDGMYDGYQECLLQFAEEAVRKAGLALKENINKWSSIDRETSRDIKINADKKSENLILSVLSESTNIAVLSEEAGWNKERENLLYWVVDPLDGTVNYVQGIDLCCVSIALMKGWEPLLGVVYDFNRDEMFSGVCGQSAWLNGQEIRVSQTSSPDRAVLNTGFPARSDFSEQAVNTFVKNLVQWRKVRMLGTAALSLSYVACGKSDAYHEKNIMLWDVAAGCALVKAAGGDVHISGDDFTAPVEIKASNSQLINYLK